MHVHSSTESMGSWVPTPSAVPEGADPAARSTATPIDRSTGPNTPKPPTAHPAGASFEQVFRGLGKELDRGEALTERALAGNAMLSSGGLLLLQAGIYRYAETVDLVTKLIDRGTQAVRTTLQNP